MMSAQDGDCPQVRRRRSASSRRSRTSATWLRQASAHYDAMRQVYTIASAGANTWYHVDHFNYLWTRAAGDLALTAQISFPPHRYSHDPNPHRKGLLMFRQSLDPGSAYVDAALHGVGLTALQYRRERGANTPDIELTIDAPQTLRLEKRGDVFTLYVSRGGGAAAPGRRIHPAASAGSLLCRARSALARCPYDRCHRVLPCESRAAAAGAARAPGACSTAPCRRSSSPTSSAAPW